MVLNSGPRRCSRKLPWTGVVARVHAGRRERCRRPASVSVLLIGMTLAGVAAQPARAAAVVGLSEGALHFGDQKVGTTSDPRVLVLSNHGPGTLSIAGVSVIGANAGDFSVSAGGGASTLPQDGGRKIAVTFTPQAKGERTAQLQINDDGQGSPQIVSLTGTGTVPEGPPAPGSAQPLVSVSPSVLAPVVSLTPTSLSFPLRPVGSTSPVMTLKLKNIGTATLHIINVTFGGRSRPTSISPAGTTRAISTPVRAATSP